jgi:hypothetical protein
MLFAFLPKKLYHSRKHGEHNYNNITKEKLFLTMGMFPKKKPRKVRETTQNTPPVIL